MQVKTISLTSVVVIAAFIIGFKIHLAATTQVMNSSTKPRVLLVANLAEAEEEGDSCAEIIDLVRTSHDRGVAVQEVDASRKSPLISQFHVTIVPTVLILDANGKETSRLEGEGGDVIRKLRLELAQLK